MGTRWKSQKGAYIRVQLLFYTCPIEKKLHLKYCIIKFAFILFFLFLFDAPKVIVKKSFFSIFHLMSLTLLLKNIIIFFI